MSSIKYYLFIFRLFLVLSISYLKGGFNILLPFLYRRWERDCLWLFSIYFSTFNDNGLWFLLSINSISYLIWFIFGVFWVFVCLEGLLVLKCVFWPDFRYCLGKLNMRWTFIFWYKNTKWGKREWQSINWEGVGGE